jgi:hypothetical protein
VLIEIYLEILSKEAEQTPSEEGLTSEAVIRLIDCNWNYEYSKVTVTDDTFLKGV